MNEDHKLCIVDDDPIAVFGIKRGLLAIGHSAKSVVFEDGLDALDAFKKWHTEGTELPSPIFIDLNMPVMDGWDVMEEFIKLIPDAANRPEIYIMTSSIDLRDLEKAKVYSLESNYLVKPISKEVLEGIFN